MSHSLYAIRKVRLVWGFAILGIIAGALLFVGRAQAESLGFSLSAATGPGAAPEDVSVMVLDDATQRPLMDAQVILADSLADDSSGHRSLTGRDGASLFKGGLSRARTLSVSKEGYTAIGIIGVKSAQITVHLKPLPQATSSSDQVIASGILTGWPTSPPRDVVSAGLVFRSLSAFDLLHFEPDALISPLKDTIDVFGSHDIPSNLVLPEQSIFLLFGSIVLNKPTYRLPVMRGQKLHLAGAQGTIPVKDLLPLLQGGGKASLALLNKLNFTRAGISSELQPDSDFRKNVNAGLSLRPFHKVTVSAPPFTGDVIVAAAVDMNGDRAILLPTDIKLGMNADNPSQIKPVTLNAADASVGKAHEVLTIAMSEKARKISGIVNDQAGAIVHPGAFLQAEDLADAVALPTSLNLRPMPTGLSAAVFEAGNSAVWYVYSLPSAGTNSVPARRLPGLEKVSAFSVVSLDFGPTFDEKAVDGQSVMRKLQRFTRSTAKVVKSKP